MRRPFGIFVVLALLVVGAAIDLFQVSLALRGKGGEPGVITFQKLLTGTLATVSAVGVWRRASWAPITIVAWGVALAVLLGTLPIVLDLPAEARPGLWSSAAIGFGLAMGAAWYVKRSMTSARSPQSDARGA